MPERQHAKLYTPAPVSDLPYRVPPPVRYVELHCKTNFSFLEGASHPDELVVQATKLGYEGLAITDRNSVAGVVRAHTAAKKTGLKLLIGAEITLVDANPVLLWVTNREGYGWLCKLITRGRRNAPKGECHLTFADVAEHAKGLLLGAILPRAHDLTRELLRWREIFHDRAYAVAELHRGPCDARRLGQWRHAARTAGMPLVAAGDVHYHDADRRYLQDVLTAIRLKTTVAELGATRFPNGERRLRSLEELIPLFATCPAVISRTAEVAGRCTFSLDELRYDYPEELYPDGETPSSYLARLTLAGARARYPEGIPAKVSQLIERELAIIEDLNYAAYFLTVWDLVRFARSKDILCQGRGSAANSAVCYCLGVTSVDPDVIDVLFERFISKERDEAPDIDIDFEHQRREEVIQYVYEKYGRDRAGMTAELITYRPRSGVRDVGKALGLSLDRVDALAKAIGLAETGGELIIRFREAGVDPACRLSKQLQYLVGQILGFPRHLSQHVGGMVLSNLPLCELVPIENASMPNRTVIQWDKDDLDALGILKVDCLALGMLSAIRRALNLLREHSGLSLTLADIPADDPATYTMIQRADTVGAFQIESRAQMSMLPRLKPEKFYDLVIQVAIVRPGPIQGKMVHPYLRRRNNQEQVEYPSEAVRDVLTRTLGVPLFQEQAMKLVVVAAGFTPAEADQLRRAMGAWKRTGIIDQFERRLIRGMLSNGYSEEFAHNVFHQIEGFGSYGFPESHAVSFALLAYVSAWIKCHHPAVFLASLLNSQPMGFYAPSQLVSDARAHGVEVRPVDVNDSKWDSTLERREDGMLAVRLGWSMIKGLSQSAAETLVDVRQARRFTSYNDFVQRTKFTAAILSRLASADAFRSLDLTRRPALWQAFTQTVSEPLFANLLDEAPPELPLLSPAQEVINDYHAHGLSLRGHPFAPLRESLTARRVVTAAALQTLPADHRYRVAGLVLLRQRPGTAKGVTFMTLEDETGTTNLIVWRQVWEKFRRVARQARALLVSGKSQRQDGVLHFIVDRMTDLTAEVDEVGQVSRDFR
ncbi:MAG: polymerase alpha subunit [Planctomycetota bacterium]|nr:polymerase alpha subunit [Planctomycetota bacterium]